MRPHMWHSVALCLVWGVLVLFSVIPSPLLFLSHPPVQRNADLSPHIFSLYLIFHFFVLWCLLSETRLGPLAFFGTLNFCSCFYKLRAVTLSECSFFGWHLVLKAVFSLTYGRVFIILGLPSLHGLFALNSFSVGLFPCLAHAMRPFQMLGGRCQSFTCISLGHPLWAWLWPEAW